MDNPELYGKYNSLTKAALTQLFNEYAGKIKWRNSNEIIIDLGSGDGSVTTMIKKYIPTKDSRIVGSDINQNMVDYANEHYSQEGITFRILDIEGHLPNELRNKFNHAISFFALHFIKNQEKCFRNIYDLMTDGGACFLVFLKYIPFYDLFIQASQKNKWKPWLQDVNKFVSPYYNIEDAEKYITDMMEAIGFTHVHVQCRKMTYAMQNGTEFKNLLKAVQTFSLPDDVFEDLINESVPLAKQLGLLDEACNSFEENDKAIEINYQALVVYATKP